MINEIRIFKLTEKGEEIFLELLESYDPKKNAAYSASMPLKEIFGKFPEIMEVMAIVRNIYGDDFMEIFEKSFSNIENEFIEEDGKLEKREHPRNRTCLTVINTFLALSLMGDINLALIQAAITSSACSLGCSIILNFLKSG